MILSFVAGTRRWEYQPLCLHISWSHNIMYDYCAWVGNSTLSRNFECTLNRHKGHRVSSKRHNEVVRPAHLYFLSIILPHQRGAIPNKTKITNKNWARSAPGSRPARAGWCLTWRTRMGLLFLLNFVVCLFVCLFIVRLRINWSGVSNSPQFQDDGVCLSLAIIFIGFSGWLAGLNAIWRQYCNPRTLESGHPALERHSAVLTWRCNLWANWLAPGEESGEGLHRLRGSKEKRAATKWNNDLNS